MGLLIIILKQQSMKVLQHLMGLSENRSTTKMPNKNGKVLNKKRDSEDRIVFQSEYFSGNPMVEEISRRTESEIQHSNIPGLAKADHLSKASSIMEDLFNRHKQVVKKIEELRKEKSNQQHKDCTFKPQVQKPQKYIFEGDVVRRNEIWLEEKRKRGIQKKEEDVMENLRKCTFSPSLVSRELSQAYLKNRASGKKGRERRRESVMSNLTNVSHLSHVSPMSNVSHVSRVSHVSPAPLKKQPNGSQYQAQKRSIVHRLHTRT